MQSPSRIIWLGVGTTFGLAGSSLGRLAPSQGERPSTPSFTAEFMTRRRVEATLMTVVGDLPDPEMLAIQKRTCDGWIEASRIRGRA